MVLHLDQVRFGLVHPESKLNQVRSGQNQVRIGPFQKLKQRLIQPTQLHPILGGLSAVLA